MKLKLPFGLLYNKEFFLGTILPFSSITNECHVSILVKQMVGFTFMSHL